MATSYYPLNYSAPMTDVKSFQNMMALYNNGAVKGVFHASGAIDPSSLIDGAGEVKTLTVTGVALGDAVLFYSAGVSLAGITVTAYVSAADTVSFRIQNESTGTLDIATSTWTVAVLDLT
jgi:hypothetical protein